MPEPELTARMMQLITGAWVAQTVSAAATLGVADVLSRGPYEVKKLAAAVGADEDALHRLLRALASVGIVEGRPDGRTFELTEMGGLLTSDALGPVAVMIGSPSQRTAWSELAECVRTGGSSFERLFGDGFAFFRDRAEEGETFNAAMTAVSNVLLAPVVRAYGFERFGTVVDVGGGHGALLAAAISGRPGVRGVLYDLPYVIADAGEVLEEAGVAGRCELVAGDFFESVPEGGDAYLLSNILHDWGDEQAVRILANCRAAMTDGGRVLLVESVLPDAPNVPHPAPTIDMEMLVMATGARQRTAAEFDRLLRAAGLRLLGVAVEAGAYCLLEAGV